MENSDDDQQHQPAHSQQQQQNNHYIVFNIGSFSTKLHMNIQLEGNILILQLFINVASPPKKRLSPKSGGTQAASSAQQMSDNPDEIRIKRKTNKGKVEVSDIKKNIDFSRDPTINHIACNQTKQQEVCIIFKNTINQTQEYFAVATNIGFEIIQNDSSSDKLKKKCQYLNDSIELIEMMYKTNIIVLVFTRQKNKVVIWDDHEKKNRISIYKYIEQFLKE